VHAATRSNPKSLYSQIWINSLAEAPLSRRVTTFAHRPSGNPRESRETERTASPGIEGIQIRVSRRDAISRNEAARDFLPPPEAGEDSHSPIVGRRLLGEDAFFPAIIPRANSHRAPPYPSRSPSHRWRLKKKYLRSRETANILPREYNLTEMIARSGNIKHWSAFVSFNKRALKITRL